jgi:hypothetical protein
LNWKPVLAAGDPLVAGEPLSVPVLAAADSDAAALLPPVDAAGLEPPLLLPQAATISAVAANTAASRAIGCRASVMRVSFLHSGQTRPETSSGMRDAHAHQAVDALPVARSGRFRRLPCALQLLAWT